MATVFLQKNNWNLENAVTAYFNSENRSTRPIPKNAPVEKLQAIFDKYKDPDSEHISIDGTLEYLEDLGIDPEDRLSLTLAYLLKSPQTGEFHRKDFIEVWAHAGVSSVAEMRDYLKEQHKQLVLPLSEFEKLYNYVFGFVKDVDPRVKIIDHTDAISYWRLLFADSPYLTNCSDRLEQWYQFIEQTKRGISRDLWEMFYKFLLKVLHDDPEKLSGYNEMSAWHSMMDEYVEWLEEMNLLSR